MSPIELQAQPRARKRTRQSAVDRRRNAAKRDRVSPVVARRRRERTACDRLVERRFGAESTALEIDATKREFRAKRARAPEARLEKRASFERVLAVADELG